MSPPLRRGRARELGEKVLAEWESQRQYELTSLADTGVPHIEQLVDEQSDAAYMQTVVAIPEGSSHLLVAVLIQPIPTSALGALLPTSTTRVSKRIPTGS